MGICCVLYIRQHTYVCDLILFFLFLLNFLYFGISLNIQIWLFDRAIKRARYISIFKTHLTIYILHYIKIYGYIYHVYIVCIYSRWIIYIIYRYYARVFFLFVWFGSFAAANKIEYLFCCFYNLFRSDKRAARRRWRRSRTSDKSN